MRGKGPKQLCKAVEGAGGEVREYAAPKPWEVPKWTAGRARELGLRMESDTAKQLVALVARANSGSPASWRSWRWRFIRAPT